LDKSTDRVRKRSERGGARSEGIHAVAPIDEVLMSGAIGAHAALIDGLAEVVGAFVSRS